MWEGCPVSSNLAVLLRLHITRYNWSRGFTCHSSCGMPCCSKREGDALRRDASKMLTIVLVAMLALSQQRLSAATVTIVGPFTLVAPGCTTVSDANYRGKWLLVFFGYTFCPNVCPITLLEIAVVLQQLGPDASKLQPLFISIDP